MKAKKENKVYEVDKVTKDRYAKAGYDIYDDDGKLIQGSKNKTVPYEEYEKVKKELEELKANKEVKKEVKEKDISKMNKTELLNLAEEKKVEVPENATKEMIISLIKEQEENIE